MLVKSYRSPREHRKERLRFHLRGTAERPRMCVFRSARHIYVQVIDDDAGRTIASASTMESALRGFDGKKSEAAEQVGRLATERAIAQGVTKLVFDRNGFRYTGRVAAISKAAHELGLLSKTGYSGEQTADEGEPALAEQE